MSYNHNHKKNHMKNTTQAGFSLIEGLLTLIAITLVVFVGFYVYNANKNTGKVVSTTATANKSSSGTAAVKPKYLDVKSLGVRVKLSGDLKDLTYHQSQAGSADAIFTVPEFTKAVAVCRASEQPTSVELATVSRIEGKYDPSAPPVDFFGSVVKQFPDFYLDYSHADGGLCIGGNDEAKTKAANQLFDKLDPELKQAIEAAQQI